MSGYFYGVGVGPGEVGLLPVVAFRALQSCQKIYAPKAKNAGESLARRCIEGLGLDASVFVEFEFDMDPGHDALVARYDELAVRLAEEVNAGYDTSFLTIGDPMTFSTYLYTLRALLARVPGLRHRTFPGVTSYCAAAAALGWPLGERKEQLLVLPCPETPEALRAAIEKHDLVALMKIGKRWGMVRRVIGEMGIEPFCALAHRVGMPEEKLFSAGDRLPDAEEVGYLSTLLIRKTPQYSQGEII